MLGHRWQEALCDAIAGCNIVEIRYGDDFQFRTFAPHIVYASSKDKTLVGGTQINNPAEPLERNEPRNFDLEKIQAVNVTANTFTPHRLFSHLDKRYQHGVICYVRSGL